MDEKEEGETSILLRFFIIHLAAYYINMKFWKKKIEAWCTFGKGNELWISYFSFTLCSAILDDLAHHVGMHADLTD